MSNLPPDRERQIREFINADQLIYAIKLYREVTGVGLAQAKSAVEAMARDESVSIPAPQTPFNDPLLETRIREMLIKRNKIEAIKIYRQAHGVGLKEAKDAVEQMNADMQRERQGERRENVSMSTADTSLPSEPVISRNPFEDEAESSGARLVLTIAILLVLAGAFVFFLLRGF